MLNSTARIWIISELYYPEQTSTGYFLTKIAEGLARTMPVNVICGQPTYSEHGLRAASFEEHNYVRIHRVRATHFRKDKLFLRAINLVTLSVSVAYFALTRFRQGDRLLIVTNPPTLPPIVGLIARLRGVVDTHLLVHDVYPEVLAATGFLRVDSIAYQALQRVFSATFHLYNSIIVLGRDMEAVIRVKLNGAQKTVTVIPNWGDVDEVVPLPRCANTFLANNNLKAPYIIQFSGNIGLTHDIDTILAAAERLRERRDILFVFVGFGGKVGAIAEAISIGDLHNVRLFLRQPRDMLGPMLASATATVISFVGSMKGLSVPSRMYNVLSAGTPIIAIADADSELALVVVEENAGWVLEPGDVDGLAKLIERLASPDGAAEALSKGTNGRTAVTSRYTYELALDRFHEVVAQGLAAAS